MQSLTRLDYKEGFVIRNSFKVVFVGIKALLFAF